MTEILDKEENDTQNTFDQTLEKRSLLRLFRDFEQACSIDDESDNFSEQSNDAELPTKQGSFDEDIASQEPDFSKDELESIDVNANTKITSSASLSSDECIELEAISLYMVEHFQKKKHELEDAHLKHTSRELTSQIWEKKYQEAYEDLSTGEQSELSSFNWSTLNQRTLPSLKGQYVDLSNARDQKIRRAALAREILKKSTDGVLCEACTEAISALSEGERVEFDRYFPSELSRKDLEGLIVDFSKDTPSFSSEQRILRAAISQCVKARYSTQVERSLDVTFEYSKWKNLHESIKGYRKETLKETAILGRKLRGYKSKAKVLAKVSQYQEKDVQILMQRGEELALRWQKQLAKEKQANKRSVQNNHLVPPAVVEEVSRLIHQGHVENGKIYSFMRDVAKNKKAQFLSFSTSLIHPEQGFVGRCADGKWLIVEPTRAVEIPTDPSVKSQGSRISDSIVDAFFVDNASMRIGGTAYILFREAKVYEEDGSCSSELIAIKGFKNVQLEMDATLATQEWADIEKMQGVPHVIQGIGPLLDTKGQMRGIILPHFPRHLGEFTEPLAQEQLYKVFSDVAFAVGQMHLQGFYHNDIKPENILIKYENNGGNITVSEAVVTDLPNISATHDKVSVTANYCFYDEYNQVQHRSSTLSLAEKDVVRARMDVRALGITMYRAFAPEGQEPYRKTKPTHSRLFYPDPNTPYEPLPDTVDADLKELIRRMLSKDISEVPTMAEVHEKMQLVAGVFTGVPLGAPCEKTSSEISTKRPSLLRRFFTFV